MIELKPIPVNRLVSSKNKTISPNKHYAAYTTNNSKRLHIINLKDKDNLRITEKDFSYDFCNLFDLPIKIRQITFNKDSDSLYCITKKSQYVELYQFKLLANRGTPISEHWFKETAICLPFNAKSFTMDETTQELNLVGFKKKQIIYKVLKLHTLELINKSVEPVYSNITKIKSDLNTMKFSTLSTNKELNIFTETNNSWKIENTLYGCNDIPTSSQDGNILVDKKDNMLEIRSLLEPYYGKVVYRINRRFPIVDFSINAIGDKIKVFTQDLRRKDESCIGYSTFYTDGNPLLWNETDYEFSFMMRLHNNTPVNYTHKICSLFTDDNKLVILFNNSNYFYNRYTTAKNIQIISRYARAR